MVEVFESIEKYGVLKSIQDAREAGFSPMFMPQLVDTLNDKRIDSKPWSYWYSTPSVRVTGTTSQGSDVVVYAHLDNEMSMKEPSELIRQVNGAGIVSQSELEKLVKLDEIRDGDDNRRVWVIDYKDLADAKVEDMSIDEALEHPEIVPFYGGFDRARKQLEKRSRKYGKGVRTMQPDNMYVKPLARFLILGHDEWNLDGSVSGHGRVIGVEPEHSINLDPELVDEQYLETVGKEDLQRLITYMSFVNSQPPRIS